MGIRRRVELVATAYADELSIRSLAAISAITADQNVRIIGGQMASLLLTAFPVQGSPYAAPATPTPRSPPNSPAALNFTVRVPTVELALVIKALAYGSRLQDRDVEDIYRLLEIIGSYPSDEIGGWRLSETPLRALRRDAAMHLHELARRSRRLSDLDVPAARLATLIACLVSRPG